MRFGRTLRVLRTTAGLSVRELARRSELSPAYLSQVERGRMRPPSEARIRSLAACLDVSPGILLDLARRPSADVVSIVSESSEAAEFLRAAREAGLGPSDYAQLTSFLVDGGLEELRSKLGIDPTRTPKRRTDDGAAFRLGTDLRIERVHAQVEVSNDMNLFHKLAEFACESDDGDLISRVEAALRRRESEGTTSLGNGIAVPHATIEDFEESVMVAVTLDREFAFDPNDETASVRVLFVILGPGSKRARHMQILARIAQISLRPKTTDELMRARTSKDLYETLKVLDEGLPVVAPDQSDPQSNQGSTDHNGSAAPT